jgi:hypothetical protein
VEVGFWLANALVLPAWAALILAPGWAGTRRLAAGPILGLGPLLLYAALALTHLPDLAGVSPTPAGLAAFLGTPFGSTIAWTHMLAFDLWVGRWIYLDSAARPLPRWAVSLILLLTLVMGPLGLLVYTVAQTTSSQDAAAKR